MVVVTEDSYIRYAVHLPQERLMGGAKPNAQPICISIKGRKPYPIMNIAIFTLLLNGDCLSWNAHKSYGPRP